MSAFRTPLTFAGAPELDDVEKRRALYKRLFSTVDGRQVLADILTRGGVGRPAFEPGGNRDDALYFSGVHALALEIAFAAGLDMGRIGSAFVAGDIETMMEPHDDTRDEPDT